MHDAAELNARIERRLGPPEGYDRRHELVPDYRSYLFRACADGEHEECPGVATAMMIRLKCSCGECHK